MATIIAAAGSGVVSRLTGDLATLIAYFVDSWSRRDPRLTRPYSQ